MIMPDHKTYMINNTADAINMIRLYKKCKSQYCSFDSETDGLNIMYSTPFLIVYGFIDKEEKMIYTFSLDLEKVNWQTKVDTFYLFYHIAKQSKRVIGHNTTFDLHMLDHVMENKFHELSNLTDTQFLIRLGNDALSNKEGGVPMGLKDYIYRFIDPKIKAYEQRLKQEITRKKKEGTKALKEALIGKPIPNRFKVTGKEKSWTMEVINKFMDNKHTEIADLPEDIIPIVQKWFDETPDPNNYRLLNREHVTEYAHKDVFYTIVLFLSLREKIIQRHQLPTLRREEKGIKAFYTLEKTGGILDLEYTYKAKDLVKNYIFKLKEQMAEITGTPFTANQHKEIKKYLYNKWDIEMSSTDKAHLEKALRSDRIPDKVKKLIQIIIKLRSLDKWYATYIVGWLKQCEMYDTNIVYPQYNSAGAATGRVSSDFQQFPKKAISTLEGKILFHPRRMFKAPEDKAIYYLDYAAMEMRMLAIYTMLLDKGDLNLCRAFIPYKCIERNGKHYLEESPETEWHPTKIHDLTTKNAFGLTGDESDYQDYRNKGKAGNFAIIYGAMAKTLSGTLNVSFEVAKKIYDAFFISFPNTLHYNQYVESSILAQGYTENLFQRRYYGISPHLGKNYLIQGSCADYTKELLIQLVDYLEDYESQIQGYLHDEFSFLIPDHERYIIPKLKEIMEQLETEIVMEVDIEYTTTYWSEKHAYKFD